MTDRSQPHGVLPLDKPVGPTSHDAVAAARRALGTRRIGHAGTLDPFASGLLLLCVGAATRLAAYVTALDKTYDAVLRLGAATDTDDHTGAVIADSAAWRDVTPARLEAAFAAQVGARPQVPPHYSAKKVAGRRSYELARAGAAVDLAPVSVHIHSLRLVAFTPPDAAFEVVCSSGTYIRAIARDVGAALGCHAHLTALRRTAIGVFNVADAVPLATLDAVTATRALRPPLTAVAHLPRRQVDEAGARRLALGQALAAPRAPDTPAVAVLHADRLVAIAEISGGGLRPRKVLGDD